MSRVWHCATRQTHAERRFTSRRSTLTDGERCILKLGKRVGDRQPTPSPTTWAVRSIACFVEHMRKMRVVDAWTVIADHDHGLLTVHSYLHIDRSPVVR